MENKLIVVIMGPGKKHFAEMCVNSVKEADEIFYWTSNKDAIMWNLSNEVLINKINIFNNNWDESDGATNGKCRQRYLDCLKENHPDDWCLVLDEDEILDDNGIEKVKEFIKEAKPGLYNVKMRHFIGNIGHEDATVPVHVVPGRLFKISEAEKYPLHSHPVLQGELMGACLDATIWHLGHLPVEYMDYILKRYKQHSKDSVIHTSDFLKQWKMGHLLGLYPNKQINPLELPKQICDRYEINKDEFYFANRGLEVKHFLMAKQWSDFINNKLSEDEDGFTIIEFGCGKAPFGYALENYGNNYTGIDISKFAILNGFIQNIHLGNICDYSIDKEHDLVLCIDILEHLKYDELNKAIENVKKHGNNFIFSIPYVGDPNLEADPTHIIKEDKEWWVNKLSKYFKIKDVPADWMFANQLLIGEKNE